jgi:SRSO17 transposase
VLARLYLPAGWLRENADAAEKGVPEEHRRFTPKTEIGLALLDAVREAGEPARPVAAEAGYVGDTGFAEGARGRGLTLAEGSEEVIGRANERAGWLKAVLGLDHFEGRTWHGWHHHTSLVFTAYDLLAAEQRGGDWPPFSSLPR